MEDNCIANNTPENRYELSKCKAEFIRYLKIQDYMFRKKKTRVRWMNEDDANTAYFHATIKDNRRKLNIRRIQDDHGNWLEGDH